MVTIRNQQKEKQNLSAAKTVYKDGAKSEDSHVRSHLQNHQQVIKS